MNANVTPRSRKRNQAPPVSDGLPLANAETAAPDVALAPVSEVPAAAQPSTALTIPERARVALKSEQTERDFTAMVEKSKDIALITNADGRTQCHAMLMDYVRARTTLEASDKEARAELVAVNTAIIAERKRLAEIIEVEEKRLRAVRDAWDAKIAEEKRLKAEAEQRRKQAIENRIEEIRGTREEAMGKTATEIAAIIATVEAIAIDETFAELKLQADSAKSMTLGKLRYLHTAAIASEAEAKRLQEVRERLDREKAEQDAEAARQAAQLQRQREEQEAAAARIKAVQDARDAAAAEQQRLYDEEQERVRERHEMALQVERERIAEESRNAEEARQRRERAMDAIRAIQDRVNTAAEGDSLQAYDLALSVTQGEAITEGRFGAMVETARTTQANTLSMLRQRRVALAKRLADEAELEEQRRQQEAETHRLADVQAEIDRQQEALRLSRETVVAPSDPVEATDAEDVQPSNIETIIAEFRKPARPSDAALVKLFARLLAVDWDTMLDWLRDMDLEALAEIEPPTEPVTA